jgi:hypothetical protein
MSVFITGCKRRFEFSPLGANFAPEVELVLKNCPQTPTGNFGKKLKAQWVEIHPLFNGIEYDVAIIGLKTLIERSLPTLFDFCPTVFVRQIFARHPFV